MGLTFAGQTHGLEQGAGGPPSSPAPCPPQAGSVDHRPGLVHAARSPPEISLVFVVPFVRVARLSAAVTFGLLEDK